MIDINSNCSRVDAVKAQATQLKLQSAQAISPRPNGPVDDASRKVKSDLATLDSQIKSDDAKKAELALAVTKKDISTAQTDAAQQSSRQNFRGLDAYA